MLESLAWASRVWNVFANLTLLEKPYFLSSALAKVLTNPHIDKLVQISWRESRSHVNEIVFTRKSDDADLSKPINEKDDSVEKQEGDLPLSFTKEGRTQVFEETPIATSNKVIIAVDTGLVHLGDFVGGGIAFAIRGTAICQISNEPEWVLRYNTGPLLVDHKNIVSSLRYIGQRLGNEELYLDKLNDGTFTTKEQILSNANQIQDRFRNFVERVIQEEAIGIMMANNRGLLLIDGALPAGTFDTPALYMRQMLETTLNNRIDVAAISKKTRITIAGKPLGSLFDEKPAFVGYMPLTEVITAERERLAQQGLVRRAEDVTLGNEIYAARFGLGPPALTFRVDVKNSKRSTPADVVNAVFSDCQIYGCYPKLLIEAHQHSSFLHQDIQLLLADLVVRTGAHPKERQSMDWLFAPVGSFGK